MLVFIVVERQFIANFKHFFYALNLYQKIDIPCYIHIFKCKNTISHDTFNILTLYHTLQNHASVFIKLFQNLLLFTLVVSKIPIYIAHNLHTFR